MKKAPLTQPDISVVIPVGKRQDDPARLHQGYLDAIASCGKSYEFIYILDGPMPDYLRALKDASHDGTPLKIIELARSYGESTALNLGIKRAEAEIILQLPAYEQIIPESIPKLLDALVDCDMVLAYRTPRKDSFINRIQSRLFSRLLSGVADLDLIDVGCEARAIRRKILDEIPLYGDLDRFLPLLAHQRGFRVQQLGCNQSPHDAYTRLHSPGVYVHRVLDLLTVVFLLRFTKKPLRFFGMIGSTLVAGGGLWTLWLIVERLFYDVSLGDRPALVLSSLLIVLGIQVIAIGLVGELLIFTHARDLNDYTVERVVE